MSWHTYSFAKLQNIEATQTWLEPTCALGACGCTKSFSVCNHHDAVNPEHPDIISKAQWDAMHRLVTDFFQYPSNNLSHPMRQLLNAGRLGYTQR